MYKNMRPKPTRRIVDVKSGIIQEGIKVYGRRVSSNQPPAKLHLLCSDQQPWLFVVIHTRRLLAGRRVTATPCPHPNDDVKITV
jgi:hypothetical protein